jgi:Ca2+-binding EF-hand superfamily protein
MTDDPELDATMKVIREQIVRQGGGGLQALGRRFRIADDNADGRIDLQNELPKMLKELKINLTPAQLEKAIKLLDRDGNGSLDFEEFLFCLAPPMNAARIQMVNRIYDKLERDKDNILSRSDIAVKVTDDPRYNHLCLLCDKNGSGQIERNEFLDYYREISPSIDRDDYFQAMLNSAWKL